jgi:hypothetical protein
VWSLLVAPDVDVEQSLNGWRCWRDGIAIAEITVFGASRISRARGGDSPRRGWYSPSFGQLEPSWQLLAEAELGNGAELVAELGFGVGAAERMAESARRAP